MIGIIDIGISNIKNICRFFENVNEDYIIINSKNDFDKINLLVLPGVGSFGSAMNKLHDMDYSNKIISHVKKGKMLLGVCLGMQLMMESSEESAGINGLGLIKNAIKKLKFNNTQKKIHVGWNEIKFINKNENLFYSLNDKAFYFTHSYYLSYSESDIFAKTLFNNNEIISFFLEDNIVGCQFHLELSGRNGYELIKRILEYEKKQ